MPVTITITNAQVSKGLLYQFRDKQGRSYKVPVYQLVLSAPDMPDEYFLVTRDSSSVVFGDGVHHYGTNGECPPSREGVPYHAVWHNYGQYPDSLRLFEIGIECDPKLALVTLRGTGPVLRTGILIHHGPGYSEGCFTIAGGKYGYYRFRVAVARYLSREAATELHVYVLPRHIGDQNPLSSL